MYCISILPEGQKKRHQKNSYKLTIYGEKTQHQLEMSSSIFP